MALKLQVSLTLYVALFVAKSGYELSKFRFAYRKLNNGNRSKFSNIHKDKSTAEF